MSSMTRVSALVAAGFAILTTAATPAPVSSAGGFTYSVCAVEPFDNGLSNTRALHGASTVSLQGMTVEQCASFCSTFKYFGVEYGSECYCGNIISQGTTVDSTGGCSFPCAGDANEACGGSGRMNLYQGPGAAAPGLPSTFTPNATASTPLSNWNYVNCAVEPFYRKDANTTARAFNAQSTVTSQLTVEYCANFCAGYAYFGVEYTDECYCGNSVDPLTQLESCGTCSSLCSGDISETCGGPGHLSLYKANNATQPVFASPSPCSAPSSTAGSGTGTGTGSSPTFTGINCPAANGTTYNTMGQTYQIECGIDRQGGGTVYSQATNSFGACADLCSNYPTCVDISYVSGNCYLKNVINPVTYNSAVYGAKLIAGPFVPTTVSASNGQAYNYLGVVNEPAKGTKRALTLATTSANNMTLESCASFCTQSQATFFGVEGSSDCYCGNSFTTGSTQVIGVPGTALVACSGNAGEQCGVTQELTVFSLPGTTSPFDSNGNLIASSGTTTSSSVITASANSACNTNSATVCQTSATCISVGQGSSTCSITTAPPATTITASLSSACQTSSGTVCGASATCKSLGASSSSCSLTSTSTAPISSACQTASGTVCGSTATCVSSGASSVCSPTAVITTTASLNSACQTASGTVCGSTATCVASGGSSVCSPTAAGATTTASVNSACQTASGTVCGPSATCKSLGISSSSCSLTTTATASVSSACNLPSGTVCAASATCVSLGPSSSTCSAVATGGNSAGTTVTVAPKNACNPSGSPASVCQAGVATCTGVSGASTSTCAYVTSTQTTAGGACATPTNGPATACGGQLSCSSVGPTNSFCVYPTSTQSTISSACGTPTNGPATACGGQLSCTSTAGAANSQCLYSTITTTAGGQCTAPANGPNTVCGASQSCSSVGPSSSNCAYSTITQSTIGAACASPTAGVVTQCGNGAACQSVGPSTSQCQRVTSTASVSAACNTQSATVCQSGIATCQSLGASQSTCNYITTTAAVSKACNTQSATLCQNGIATCRSLGASTSTCDYITTTAAVSKACNTNSATVCASGTATCQSLGATSTCDYITSTAPVAARCNTAAPLQTQCQDFASCQSVNAATSTCSQSSTTENAQGGMCQTPAPSAAVTACGTGLTCQTGTGTTTTCGPTKTAASFATCTPNFDISSCNNIVGDQKTSYDLWYGPANNGTYQTTLNGNSINVVSTSACAAAKACGNNADGSAYSASFGMVYVPSKCYFTCGRFNVQNGPPFNNTYSAISYSFGWTT